MNRFSAIKTLLAVLTIIALNTFTRIFSIVSAATLPPVVLNYLYTKNPEVKVRFDGFVTFPNGEMYLPIFPQSLHPEQNPPESVLVSQPADVDYPDLVQFDNNFFLIRLVNTASGKLALARLDVYPIAMKEGLLPQDLVLPSNLYLPTELKIILGDLPYNPDLKTEAKPDNKATLAQTTTTAARKTIEGQRLYITDLTNQSLISIDPANPEESASVPLNCVASDMAASADHKNIFVTCLTTNEMAVVDTVSNLVKTRVEVGSKPTGVMAMIDRDWVAVSHRFSNFVSLINTKAFNGTSRVLLPGNGGKMAYSTSTGKLYVADHSAGQVYEIDMDTQEVVRTIAGMKNMSDILVDDRNIEKPMLWFTSRTKNKLVQVDLTSGEALKAFDAGEKPVSIRQAGDLLFVVSASSDELQLIDMQAGQKLLPIAMEPGAFPTDITISPADQKGYVAAAGTDHVYVVDFGTRNVEKTLPIEARGLDVLLISDTPTSSDVLKAFSSALIDSATPEPTLAPLQESPQGPLEPESASAKVSILD